MLQFSNKKAAHMIYKVVYSAASNAENNLGADADEEDVILGLYRYLGRTPSRLLALSLADAVGDRRAQNQPGTTDEYPNWRVPLTDSDGDPVLVEHILTDPRAAVLAEALRVATAPQPD